MARLVVLPALAVSLLVACGGQNDLTGQLTQYGYLRISPPRPTLSPGTLITVDHTSGESHVEVVCWQGQAFPGLVAPHTSDTEARTLTSSATSSLGLEAAYLDSIKANANYNNIENITLSLSNAHVLECARADFYEAYDGRSFRCKQAVADAETSGKTVYTVVQALQADVTYHIVSKAGAGAGVGLQKDVLAGLAAELGGSVSNESDLTICGKGIFWGLFPDVIKSATRGAGGPFGPALSSGQRMTLVRGPGRLVSESSAADRISGAGTEPPSRP